MMTVTIVYKYRHSYINIRSSRQAIILSHLTILSHSLTHFPTDSFARCFSSFCLFLLLLFRFVLLDFPSIYLESFPLRGPVPAQCTVVACILDSTDTQHTQALQICDFSAFFIIIIIILDVCLSLAAVRKRFPRQKPHGHNCRVKFPFSTDQISKWIPWAI